MTIIKQTTATAALNNQEAPNITGLTSQEVARLTEAGEVNIDTGVKTRSVKTIIFENICTLFNAINFILALFVLFTGSFKNMLFMIVIICNTVIGIVQEIRSKRVTDKLSIVASSKAHVVRDGSEQEVALDALVRGDIIILGRGNQVLADCEVVSGTCDANESLLTGESKLIPKQVGDKLLSGSFINAGKVYARVIHVGAENYAAKISAEAKKHKAINSEIMRSLNKVIKFVSCIMFPVGIALFSTEYFISHTELNSAILSTVSALVGMIPEGLILLTSTVLAVAVVRLAQSKVLVQQLYCIETLARVSVLCLDKTGTITTGNMEVCGLYTIDGQEISSDDSLMANTTPDSSLSTDALLNANGSGDTNPGQAQEVIQAFASLAHADKDPNETSLAIKAHFKNKEQSQAKITPKKCVQSIPFSSDKKWSGAVFEDGSAYVMGAAQFILSKQAYKEIEPQAQKLAAKSRLLLLARVDGFDKDKNIIGTPYALGFIGIRDEIRSTAAQTIQYFKEQGVRVIVISGDDPRTVSGIAQKVGIENAQNFIDASTLKNDDDIEKALQDNSVFGRVKPEQKKAFVLALQKAGHSVAMTGDGVNDTLALKASDCSVAMAAGSDAARNVAHLVLVDNDFASMPKVVAEGRRSINNLQRSASLFLVKTLLCISTALLFIFLPWQYPFQPIQMTFISVWTIGIPSFVLALEPNRDRIKGHFLENVIVRSIPGAFVSMCAILAACWVGDCALGLDYGQVSTLCVLLAAWTGANLVFRLSIPFTPIRAALLVVIVAGAILAFLFMPKLFVLSALTPEMIALLIIVGALGAIIFHLFYWKLDAWHNKRQARLV